MIFFTQGRSFSSNWATKRGIAWTISNWQSCVGGPSVPSESCDAGVADGCDALLEEGRHCTRAGAVPRRTSHLVRKTKALRAIAICSLEQLFFTVEVSQFFECRAIDQQILQSTSGIGNGHCRQYSFFLLRLCHTWFFCHCLFTAPCLWINFGSAALAGKVCNFRPLDCREPNPTQSHLHKWQSRCGRRTRGGRGAACHNGFPFVRFLPQTRSFRQRSLPRIRNFVALISRGELLQPFHPVSSWFSCAAKRRNHVSSLHHLLQMQKPKYQHSWSKSHCPPALHRLAALASLYPPK